MRKFHSLLIIFLFINFISFGQKNNSFWLNIKNEVANESLLKKIENQRKNAKAWNQQDQLKFHQFLAEINYELNHFESSRIQSDYGLTLSKKLANDSLHATFLRYKGRNFYFLLNKEKAIACFQAGIRIAEKNNYFKLKADIINNLAILRIDEVKIVAAEKLLEQAVHIFNKHSDSSYHGFLQARYLLIACNRYTKKVKNVIPLCEELLNDLRKTKETKLLAGHLFFYSFCLAEDGENQKAIALLDEAIKLTENSENIDLRRQALNEKATVLSKIGKFKEAYIASNESLKLYSKMLKRDVALAASEADVKYQSKQKEEEIKAQKIVITKKQNEKVFLLILVLLSIIIFVIIFLFLRKNHRFKTGMLIRQQKEESLQKIIEGQENERTRIAKELHDGIVQDLTVLKMNLKNNSTSAFFESDLEKITKEVRNLSYQMMPVTLKEFGLTNALEELFDRSFAKNHIKYEFECFSEKERFSEKIEISIYRICQELINNTLKHANATEISIILHKKPEQLILIFEDNGLGFNLEKVNFGIGLNSLQSRLDFVSGKLEIDSKPNEGTRVFIKIPI